MSMLNIHHHKKWSSKAHRIAWVIDKNRKNERMSVHLSYDEAHMSIDTKKRPPLSQGLEQVGYREQPFTKGKAMPISLDKVWIKTLSDLVAVLQKATEAPTGYDLFNAKHALIPEQLHKLIYIDITMKIHCMFMDKSNQEVVYL